MSSTSPAPPMGLDTVSETEIRSNHLISRLDQDSEDAEKRDRARRTECSNADSDCESDTSEVLSVGSEPTPTSVVGVRVCGTMRYHDQELTMTMTAELTASSGRGEFRDEENTRTSETSSPASSTSCNDLYYQRTSNNHVLAPSPPGYSQPPSSPTASSVRSPASSSAAASSPGRPEAIQEAIVPRYQSGHQHLLSRYSSRESEISDYPTRVHGIGHEIIYPTVERLHRTPISVPLVTRLSLSPPSAMTVTGLQATTPGVLHPAACRDPRETATLMPHHSQHLHHPNAHTHLQQGSQVQHVPANSVHQHRLSVSKLLQRDSGSPASPTGTREENGRTLPAANGVPNTIGNNGNHHHNNHNNNNNLQHQGLKFSIDNILKADFGRRITDPISLKKSRPKKVSSRPIDLTKDFLESSSDTSERSSSETTTTTTTTTNASPTGVSTGNSASKATGSTATDPGKMLWPAWVYCTRYSDRPSSGRSK
ncbi:segmentation polarity homeobox protein engrailed [Polyergus mexicanus]|uniref:segmentation polarity homeobox protein engrailed n=1 Tax=Polyergus mexicanus TaxID=615972 RepID=UPI0038B65783